MEILTRQSAAAAGAARRNTAAVFRRLLCRLVAAGLVLATAATATLHAASASASAEGDKVLRVATSGDYAPFSFETGTADSRGSEAGDASVDGFDLEVARLFAREHGYRVELLRFRWPELGRLLAAGSFDVAMSGVTVRSERSIAGRYSVPVARTHAVALTWKGSGAAQKNELDRPSRRIAVNAGGHLEQVARLAFANAEIVALADNDAVRMARLDRSFDAVVSDNFEQRIWVGADASSVAIGPLSDDRKAYLMPAGRDALAAELDRFLIAREKDGTLARLRERWFGADPALAATAEPVAALASAVAERLALMPMVFEAKRQAGRIIEDKAQEAAVVDAALRSLDAAALATGKPAGSRDAARRLFEVLIEISKDEQQRLLQREGKSRPGVVLRTTDDATASVESSPGAQPPSGQESVVAGPAEVRPGRLYDLAGELRPAIGRITDKIARIVVEIDRPLAAADVQRNLESALAAQDVGPERLQQLTDAIVAIAARAQPAPG